MAIWFREQQAIGNSIPDPALDILGFDPIKFRFDTWYVAIVARRTFRAFALDQL